MRYQAKAELTKRVAPTNSAPMFVSKSSPSVIKAGTVFEPLAFYGNDGPRWAELPDKSWVLIVNAEGLSRAEPLDILVIDAGPAPDVDLATNKAWNDALDAAALEIRDALNAILQLRKV